MGWVGACGSRGEWLLMPQFLASLLEQDFIRIKLKIELLLFEIGLCSVQIRYFGFAQNCDSVRWVGNLSVGVFAIHLLRERIHWRNRIILIN